MGVLLRSLLTAAVCSTLVLSQNDLQDVWPPGWTEKCIGCICEASSGCNQTLECVEQNDVKYCGVFLLSDIYWQDAGAPVLIGDDPNRIGAFERCVRDPYCAARAVNQYIQRYAKDCNRDGTISCDDYVRLHYFGEANCNTPIGSLPYYRVFRNCIAS
ncbi:lysozyme-like [Daktulosphaira vitifoliae]|uniref:lysozyme-like n=1 Tax=Daktulosphaira vitifoliae TaxID=58002 RepID=UPI0021AA62B2|nr:lysozyme-like [Daktulosphaira vitifoliae]